MTILEAATSIKATSTRVCIKNIPLAWDTIKLQSHLMASSQIPLVITDCKILMHQQKKISRQLCFVGFRNEAMAQHVVDHLHQTYAKTNKLSIEMAFGKQSTTEEHRPWSKHSKGSSKYNAIHGNISVVSTEITQPVTTVTTTSTTTRTTAKEDQVDLKKQEFLSAMGVADKPKFWQNDDGGAIVDVSRVHDQLMNESSDEEEEEDTSNDDSSSVDDDADALTKVIKAAHGTVVSDRDFLHSKTSNKDNLDSDSEDDNEESISQLPMNKTTKESSDDSTSDSSEDDMEKPISEIEPSPVEHDSPPISKSMQTKTPIDPSDDNPDNIAPNRVFVRNLPFSTTEDDLRDHFSQFGPLLECHIPVDDQKRNKGFAFIAFTNPQDAIHAKTELDGTDFQGRLIHVIQARRGVDPDTVDTEDPSLTYKQKQELLRKQQALKASQGWSASFVRGDAVLDNLAERLGIRKGDILNVKDDLSSGDAAVRLALGETQIIEENRSYFTSHGVDMEALVSAKKNQEQNNIEEKRSSTSILVKNLPFDTKEDDLMKLFVSAGDAPRRILLPPSRTIAMVEYSHATDAKRAFKKLAYKRFKHVPLYLEWAPLAAQTNSDVTHTMPTTKTISELVDKADAEEEALDGLTGATPNVSYSIYVKNLNFATTEDQLQQLFAKHTTVRAVKIPTKVAAIKKGRTKTEESDVFLSMGFGFVECDSEPSVRKAITSLQGYVLDGHALELMKSSKAVGTIIKVPTNPKSKNPTKLMVRNVPFQASRTEILKLFGSFGQLKKVRLPKKFDGGHRGFAFIEFLTSQEAQTAMATLSRTHLYGRHLVLEWADDKDDIDTLREKAQRDIDEKPTPRINKKIRFD